MRDDVGPSAAEPELQDLAQRAADRRGDDDQQYLRVAVLERQIAQHDRQDDHERRRAAQRGHIGGDRDEPRRADGLARILWVAQPPGA
jgi:hypothetical protein